MVFDPAGTLPAPIVDCRNIAEDFDGFHDSDGCPEPDNDNDGHPDGSDYCPGTDSQAGGDGMLGSPEDKNHNGVEDSSESPLTTDDVAPYVFEDWDGVLDGDGCHDAPGDDFDGDGFSDEAEALAIGTNPTVPCGNEGWPADLDQDNTLNIGDFNSFVFPLRLDGSFNKFGHPVPDADDPAIGRWNLFADGIINIGDLNAINPAVLAPTARPPMFGGEPAFGQTCPWPP